MRCPTCRKLVLAGEEDFPFCSGRCRLIDLGKWASGGYVISTPVNDPEQIENMRREESNTRRPERSMNQRYGDSATGRQDEDQTTDPDCHERS
ncbi:MAG TPA: DNA gyrase inhibitor YacG [Candidatus Saccharimonadales bacterium]|nr:DNA gyrase inhibitor YacG [Candidatus Saccharimonadales bacterium]